ncbi:MAG: hypothetical protein LBI40_02545 [Treponema sp.]|nr:hypothetical protein [Treponema sp.]
MTGEAGIAAKGMKGKLLDLKVKISDNKENLPMQRGEVTSVDMEALAFGNESEPAVGSLKTGRSRNLGE